MASWCGLTRFGLWASYTVAMSMDQDDATDAAAFMAALREGPFALIECAPGPDELRIVEWNRMAERLFGYSREEAVGRSLVGTISSAVDVAAWRRLFEDESGAPHLLMNTRKDGSVLPCEWRRQALRGEAGGIARTLCFGVDATSRIEAAASARRCEQILHAVAYKLPIVVCAYDCEGNFIYHDGQGLAGAGLRPGQFLGQNVFALYNEDQTSVARMRRTLAGEETHAKGQAHGMAWDTWFIPVRDERGEPDGMISVTVDISEAARREEEILAKITIVERQEKMIRDLATPIIEVWDHVLVLPMMGAIDSQRAADVMDDLLRAIVNKRAECAVLDLTGIDNVDTQTAGHLVKLIQAIRLLGAEGVVTGIRPSVAQTIVALGLDMSDVRVMGTLQAGLKWWMERLRVPTQRR
jgi:rsbT co-antagonist protein RsbR